MARLKSTLTDDQADPQSSVIPERVQKLIDLYKKNSVEYPWKEEDKNERLFEFRRRLRPDTYKYEVNSVYRVRDPNNKRKEYYFYQMDATCLNQNDSTERSGNLTYGFAIEPVTEIKWNDTAKRKQPEKKREDPAYFFEWNPKQVAKLLEGSTVPCMNFYFGLADRRGQPGNGIQEVKPIPNQDDFLNATFDQLTVINKAKLGDANTPALPLVKQAEDELQKKEIERVRQLAKENLTSPKI